MMDYIVWEVLIVFVPRIDLINVAPGEGHKELHAGTNSP